MWRPRPEKEGLARSYTERMGWFDEVGSVCEWPADRVREGDWSPVQWYDAELAEAAAKIREGSRLRRLGTLHEMGPSGRRIRDAFERVGDGASTGSEIGVFDSVSSDRCASLAGDPDAVWRPRPEKEGLARSYTERMGWALLMNRTRTKQCSRCRRVYLEEKPRVRVHANRD